MQVEQTLESLIFSNTINVVFIAFRIYLQFLNNVIIYKTKVFLPRE
jgi:hypothetical protein